MILNSVLGKDWISKTYSEDVVNSLKNNLNISEILSRLIAIRKINIDEVNIYLNPKLKDTLPNPFVLKDMDKSVERCLNAIIKKEKIGIFGDYDVDGATSTAVLGNYLKSIGHEITVYIPDRKTEGYGPTKNGFDKLIKQGAKLIFTVDCGTMSFEIINAYQKKNLDIIILDHHQSELKLPNAYSIVNPNRFDDVSNLNYLCAAGVCFLFLIGLNAKLRKLKWFEKNKVKEPNLINSLDLVSLGTVCDVVPLIGLNRTIVSQGLKVINKITNPGIKILKNICGVESNLTTYHLGYVLGPRINAGGRVGKCSHGANLLLSKNPKEVFKIASELEIYNNERKILEKSMLDKIEKKITFDQDDPVIVLSGHNFHGGIIGIVASRLKEKFNKPTIIISVSNKIGKASARSILGFDIGTFIINAVHQKILLQGGGHKMAGGFSIKEENINKFKELINRSFLKVKKSLKKNNQIFFDSIISPSAVNDNFFNEINFLSPFGSGNPEPKFVVQNLEVLKSTIVGENHIKSLLVGQDGSVVKSVTFNAVKTELETYLLAKNRKKINIFGKLSLNEWKGKKNVEFIIDDISVNKTKYNEVPSSNG